MIELKDSPFWKYWTEDPDMSGDPAANFARHSEICGTYFSSLPESKAGYRYAPGKWTVREVVGHLTDANLIFLYRLVSIARGEQKPLPGFEENDYVANAMFDSQPWRTVLDSYRGVSQAAQALVAGIEPAAWERSGSANGVRMKSREMLWVLIGHERHHIRTLKERYGLA